MWRVELMWVARHIHVWMSCKYKLLDKMMGGSRAEIIKEGGHSSTLL